MVTLAASEAEGSDPTTSAWREAAERIASANREAVRIILVGDRYEVEP